jgi:uncharacterized membrane protein YeaQ/YmgE (transglycosylase-associated protein family)
MFGIIGWLLFGLLVGVVAKILVPGRDPGGAVLTVILGMVGALVGGGMGRFFGFYGPNEPAGFIMAVSGAVILLFGYRFIAGKTA